MSGFTLKLIALLCMIIDHAGLVLLSGTSLYLPCRIIGRIAFPIYAFLITEGYIYTSNAKKYAGRLLLFALLSEIPFDYAFFGTWCYIGYQNVFFTLALGLAALVCIDMAGLKDPSSTPRVHAGMIYDEYAEWDFQKKKRTRDIAWILLVLIMAAAEFGCTDYGAFGIIMIMIFYIFREQKTKCILIAAIALVLDSIAGGFTIEFFGALSLIFIWFYNGRKGRYPVPSILFYAAYPLHLLLFGFIARGI